MNTPSHSILNLAILDRGQLKGCTWPIIVGSWLPDAAIFVFYGWAKVMGLPEQVIWNEAYYTPVWQGIFAIGNSIPLALVGIGWFLWAKSPGGVALSASALLHHLEDLPLHHEDAHQHFWPLSDYRFISPVSYWDADHHGNYGALAELALVLVASVVLWRRVRSRWGRSLLLLVNTVYVGGYWQFYG
ncbi:hypothetical protein [Halomicronema sp. CCY15110]|uniref:hypothetical protein n=1 Tax=Halomicronema sp. CCY15110 TaxID=2767773 RepID=UPI0019517FF6|nr:hypothetical protein [Halomicronema sp. CCY15110]